MSLSRRKFMQAGVVAAACAALPLKSAMAQNKAGGGSMAGGASTQETARPASVERLNYYSRASFAPYLNTEFRVHLDASSSLGLKLVEVQDSTSAKSQEAAAASNQGECFSLLLTGAGNRSFEQNTYLLEHVALGSFYLFLVPVSDQGKKPLNYYEAVIYRRAAGAAKGFDAAFTPSVSGRKDKQEIFYFRLQEIAPPPAPAPDPGAAGRRAASRMAISQSPSILGLRLGMTTEQVLARFPGIMNDAEVRSSLQRPASRFGTTSLTISPRKYSAAGLYKQVTQINLTFLDGRAATLNVGYDAPVWGHVNDFVTKFAAETRLPGPDSWDAYLGLDTQLKTLRGMDFDVSLFAGGVNVNMNYAQLRDLSALQRLKERRARMSKR